MNLRQKQSKFFRMLIELGQYAIVEDIEIFINELYRTKERQEQLYKEGKTKTLKSKHIEGLAVDLIVIDKDGNIKWQGKEYEKLGKYWEEMGGIWGGRWKRLNDIYHFEYKEEK